jgi:hypothetical protein
MNAPSQETVESFVGPVNPEPQFGRPNRLKNITASPVGRTTIDGVDMDTYRIDCYCTAWTNEASLFPTTVIEPSFYAAFDEANDRIIDLTIKPNEIKSKFQSTI